MSQEFSQEFLKEIIKEALTDLPTAKWVAQDQCNGDWFAFEREPYFRTDLMIWFHSKADRETNKLAFVRTTDVMPNNQAYEISKILEKE